MPIRINSNFQLNAKEALDADYLQATVTTRNSIPDIRCYAGKKVYCQDTNLEYILLSTFHNPLQDSDWDVVASLNQSGQVYATGLESNILKQSGSYGPDLLVDGACEIWSSLNTLQNWSSDPVATVVRSTDVPTGQGATYSAYFNAAGAEIYQGYNNGSGTVNTTFWGKTGATGTIYFTAGQQQPNGEQWDWNWTGVNAGSYTTTAALTELSTNGDFENWSGTDPDTWIQVGDGTITKETTKVYTGLNAVKMTCTTNPTYLTEDLQFYNMFVGDTTNISFWVAGDAGGENAGFVLFGDNGFVQMAWDWVANDWTSWSGTPTANQMWGLTGLTTSYQNFTKSITNTATFSGSIAPRLYGSISGTVYFDTVSIQSPQNQLPSSDQRYYPSLTTSWTQFTVPEFDYSTIDSEIRFHTETGDVYLALVDVTSTSSVLSLTDWSDIFSSPYNITQSTDSHAGIYAVQLNGGGGTNYSGITQSYTSTPGTNYTVSVWGKGVADVGVVFGSPDLGYAYNFTGVNAGTYTQLSGFPTSDQISYHTFTSSYSQFSYPTVPPYASDGMAIVLISNGVVLLDTLTLKDQLGNDIAVDGDFEIWSIKQLIDNGNMSQWQSTAIAPLTNWATETFGTAAPSIYEPGDAQAGSYGVSFQLASPSGSAFFLTQSVSVSGGVSGTLCQLSYWAYGHSGGEPIESIILNSTKDHAYNWNTSAWDTYVGGVPGSDYRKADTTTNTYSQFTRTFTLYDSNPINVYVGASVSASDGIHFDTVKLTKWAASPLVTTISLDDDSSLGDLGAGDIAIRAHFNGSNSDAFRITGDGQLLTDISGGLQVVAPVNAGNIANKYYVDNKIPGGGTVTSITAGTGIVCTPNPITGAGTIALDPADIYWSDSGKYLTPVNARNIYIGHGQYISTPNGTLTLLGNIGTGDAITFGNQEIILDPTSNVLSIMNGPATGYGLTMPVFTGSGSLLLDYVGNSRTGTGAANWKVVIDNATSNPNTFKWYYNNTLQASGIHAAPLVTLTSGSDSLEISWSATANGVLNDQWTWDARLAGNVANLNALGGWVQGASANLTNVTNALSYISNGSTGRSISAHAGLVVEAASTASNFLFGVIGATSTYGANGGAAIYGQGFVNASTDTALSIAVEGSSADLHTGAYNIAFYGDAQNSSAGSFSFYGASGWMYNDGALFVGQNPSGFLTQIGKFPNTLAYISASNLSLGASFNSANNAIVGETMGGFGVLGVAMTNGSVVTSGLCGIGKVSNTSDTGWSIGVRSFSTDTHVGAPNAAFVGEADGGSENYLLLGYGDILTVGVVYGTEALLSTVNNIDATANGTPTVVYTVPTGKHAVITKMIVRCTEANTVTVVASVSAGTLAGVYVDWHTVSTLTGLNAVGYASYLLPADVSLKKTYSAGDAFSFYMFTGATATSQTYSVDTFGYLI